MINKKNFLLIILSIIFSLTLLEGSLHLPGLFNKSPNRQKIDLYKKFEYYKNKKKEQNVSLALPGNYRLNSEHFKNLLPLGQTSNSEIILCNENGYISSYRSNNFGFNSRADESNIVLLGDSFIEGACVNYKDTFVGNLEKLSNKSIDNLAISGTSILYQYSVLREYLNDNTKVILFFYEKNDLRELRSELKNLILLKYLNKASFSQNLKNKKKEIKDLLNKFIDGEVDIEINRQNQLGFRIKKIIINNNFLYFSTFPKLRNIIKNIFKKNQHQNLYKYNDQDFENYENVLKITRNFVKKKGGELIIIYLPSIERIARYSEQMDDINLKMISMFKKNKVDYFDLSDVIKNYKNPENLYAFTIHEGRIYNKKIFGHFNEEGYKFGSEAIFSKLKNEF